MVQKGLNPYRPVRSDETGGGGGRRGRAPANQECL